MTCWLVIPVKPADQAKSRLAEVLSETQRASLAGAMLHYVFEVARSAAKVDFLALLGPSRLGLPEEVPLLADPGGGLNPALHSAFSQATIAGADRLIVLFADLPRLQVSDIEQLAATTPGTIAIAPDRHGTGTNAISLPIPRAQGFTFAFGPDSFARHNAEARRLGLRIETIHSEGLARDIDVPDDLADASGLFDPGT